MNKQQLQSLRNLGNEIEEAADEIERLQTEIARLRDVLADIGEIAHFYSSGPTVPDTLWEIRQKAYAEL